MKNIFYSCLFLSSKTILTSLWKSISSTTSPLAGAKCQFLKLFKKVLNWFTEQNVIGELKWEIFFGRFLFHSDWQILTSLWKSICSTTSPLAGTKCRFLKIFKKSLKLVYGAKCYRWTEMKNIFCTFFNSFTPANKSRAFQWKSISSIISVPAGKNYPFLRMLRIMSKIDLRSKMLSVNWNEKYFL